MNFNPLFLESVPKNLGHIIRRRSFSVDDVFCMPLNEFLFRLKVSSKSRLDKHFDLNTLGLNELTKQLDPALNEAKVPAIATSIKKLIEIAVAINIHPIWLRLGNYWLYLLSGSQLVLLEQNKYACHVITSKSIVCLYCWRYVVN